MPDDEAVDQLDPTAAVSKEEFARYMRMLRARADSPAYRDLEKRALQSGRSLPRTTQGEVLSGRRFPTKAFLLTFVELCGVRPDQARTWERAWNRLAVQYKVDVQRSGVPATSGQLDQAEEDPDLLGQLQEQMSQARQSASEQRRIVEMIAADWSGLADVLAAEGRWPLAERVLKTLVELRRTFSGGDALPTLDARYALALAMKNQRDEQADVALGGLLSDCQRVLGTEHPLTLAAADTLGSGSAGTVSLPAEHARNRGEADRAPAERPARATGVLPSVWNVEPRNPEFTGRDDALADLHRRLHSGGSAVVQALRGWGGVGKTQIAIEHAHRFSGDYDIVWWIAAEDSALIGEQLAVLAVQTGQVEVGADTASAVAVIKAYLRGIDRWLLIFDNAEDPAAIRKWLPGGPGHVMITSRIGGWEHIAATVAVDVMARTESVALLRNHGPGLGAGEADRLAEALGDLPLALAQASGFLAETATSADDYLKLLHDHPRAVLSEGTTGDHPLPLVVAIGVTVDRLRQLDPVGLALVHLCAFLAPETVPVQWLVGSHRPIEDPEGPLGGLAAAAEDPVALRRGVGSISRFGLAITARGGIRLHRLTQSVIRDRLPVGSQDHVRVFARMLLVDNQPGDPEDPGNWPEWARIVPHLLAVDPASAAEPELRDLACNAAWYLIERGDADASARLSGELFRKWKEVLGPDDRHTLLAARDLARALREQGQYEHARSIYEEGLPRSQRVLGEDHPLTLRLAHGLAIDLHLLGLHEDAHRLQAEAWGRYRQVMGEDHPHTLHSANHLAVDLHALGQYEQARQLHEDTLARYRRVLGNDHPDTLRSANNLAIDLRRLGEHEHARRLQEDTLARRRRVIGEDHPHTLQSATSLSETLHGMGRHDQARILQEETLTRYLRVLDGDHPEALRASENLASIMLALGQHDEARRLQMDITAKQARRGHQ